jgi:hypothetical protein
MWLALLASASHLGAQQTTVPGDPFYTPPLTSAQQKAEVEAGKRSVIQHAMVKWGDEGMLSDEHQKRRLEMIRTCPDMGRYLVSITDEMIELKFPDISDYLEAIAMRPDIPSEAVARYIGLARRMIKNKALKFSTHEFDGEYLVGISDVLAAHPTPENEELLITLLQFGTQSHAFRALARMGTSRALPAMQKYADDAERHYRGDNGFYSQQRLNEVREGLAKLMMRVSLSDKK